MSKKYQLFNGTAYHIETSREVIEILEELRQKQVRIELDYGDTKTGRSWGEVHDIKGRIGRSNGEIKIPILLYNNRSLGGGAILDHCIIGIKSTNGGHVWYEWKGKGGTHV